MFTPDILRKMAFFYSNTDRSALEASGVISCGGSGDTAWKRFNHDFDVFLIKLSPEKLEALTAMINEYIRPSVSIAKVELDSRVFLPRPGLSEDLAKGMEASNG